MRIESTLMAGFRNGLSTKYLNVFLRLESSSFHRLPARGSYGPERALARKGRRLDHAKTILSLDGHYLVSERKPRNENEPNINNDLLVG